MPAELLSPIALDFLWEAQGAGELPYPFRVRAHGATLEERLALRHQVHDELRARNLLDQRGRLEPHLEQWLGVLASPEVSIDSVFLPELDAEPVSALAAVRDGTAVLAVQNGEGMRLSPIHASGLASAIVGQLPQAKRGSTQSMSLPAEELDEVRAAAKAGAPVGAAEGQPGESALFYAKRAMARLVSMPKTRGGQLAANSRGQHGGRRRSPVLAWFDNDTGRYFSQSGSGQDGRDWVTIAPADAAAVRQRLTEMVSAVTR